MRRSSAPRVLALTAALSALLTGPALASGGTGGGGTGGGGSTQPPATAPAPAPAPAPVQVQGGSGGACVQVNSLGVTADQSPMTAGAALSAAYQVARCGGTNTSFTVQLTADDAAGNRVLSSTRTWVPNRSVPFTDSAGTDTAAFGTSYVVTLTVSVPETGAVLTTASRPVTTPAARVPACAAVTNLGGTAGYYPGNTQAGALWLSWSVRNCGAVDGLDLLTTVEDSAGQVVRSFPQNAVVTANGAIGTGLVDVEPVPTGSAYIVRVQVRHHSDGSLLDDRSLALTTPPAK